MTNSAALNLQTRLPLGSSVFKDETLLITGCSGFLGKVILEKMLRTFPCKKIYVLLREKKQVDAISRLKSEIFLSPIFGRLRESKGESFGAWFSSMVVPIAGDLLVSGIGLKQSDRARLAAEVTVIIHAAASVEFDLPLEEATRINTDGSLEMLELAKECGGLKAHVHVSTCYVNSHLRGFVKETIYPAPFNVQESYAAIKASSSAELAERKEDLIQGWPNTYTFTKFLTEHLLVQRKERVPLIICRPSIVAASVEEPVPGWTDSISAASAVFLAVGMGICPVLPGSIWNVADVIPVDICANMIILAAAAGVIYDGEVSCLSVGHGSCSVPVMHCGTSSSGDPMTWFAAIDTLGAYFSNHPPPKQILKSRVSLVPNQFWFQIRYLLEMRLPRALLALLDGLAGSGSAVKQLNKAFKAGDRIVGVFSHFTQNEWIFESDFSRRMSAIFDFESVLNLEMREDWHQYIHMVCYGMRRFCMRSEEAHFPPRIAMACDVLQRPKVWRAEAKHGNPWQVGRDVQWVCKGVEMAYEVPTHSNLVKIVLSDPEVKNFIACPADETNIANLIDSMGARFDENSTRFFGYSLQKLFGSMFDRISVNEDALEKLKSVNDCPVLLVPTHRSYLDFLLLSYVLFAYNMKVPFIAAGEDFQRIPGVNSLLKKSGAFFMRRKINSKTDPLYALVFRKYFQAVLQEHKLVEFFVEGTRARSGNTLRHKNGLLSYALELLFEGKVKDIQIVPVSISYERVLEAESFLPEILGKPKARESLSRIFKGLSVFDTHYGRANVVLGAPSSARQLVEQASGSRFNVTSALGTFITNELNKNLVVMITHLVATALLSSPNPTSLESLGNRVDSLRDALITRNCLVDVPRIGPCAELVKKCLHSHFKDVVTVKNDHVAVKAGNSAPLTLAYYRNHLVGPIGLEAAISACFLSMSRGNTAVSVSETLLIEEALHLIPLLGIALQVSKDLIKKSIREMVHNDSLVRIEDKLKIHPNNTVSRILVSVIDPYVDCAWLTAVGIRWRRPADCDSIPVLSSRILELAQSMLSEKAIDRIEATSLETIKNTLQSFVHAGVIDMHTLPKFPDLDRIIHRIARLRTGAHRPRAADNYQALNSSEIETPAARL